eukprot:12918493-Prorocentrum_lima.AAC.1
MELPAAVWIKHRVKSSSGNYRDVSGYKTHVGDLNAPALAREAAALGFRGPGPGASHGPRKIDSQRSTSSSTPTEQQAGP